MNVDRFSNLGPAWINYLGWNIAEKTANSEDVELLMSYYCHLFDSEKTIPYEMQKLINQIFKEYLERTANNRQMYGALNAAFGLTGKQGVRDVNQRNQKIATDVARHYLNGKSNNFSIDEVCRKYELGKTTVTDAWRVYKIEGVFNYQRELRNSGKEFSKSQLKRAVKIEEKENKKIRDFLKKTGT